MSITVGKIVARVDAFDKVTGRTKYYEDRMPAGALYIRIKHAEIAHGFVTVSYTHLKREIAAYTAAVCLMRKISMRQGGDI